MANAVEAFQISDEQWIHLNSLLRLPANARHEIGYLVTTSRKMKADSENFGRPSITRAALKRLRVKTADLFEELKSMPQDIVVAMIRHDSGTENDLPLPMARLVASRNSPAELLSRLQASIQNVSDLETWLSTAVGRLSSQRSSPGANSYPVEFLVRELDKLLAKYELPRVTQSEKRSSPLPFVKAIVQIAHPDIGDFARIEAVKRIVKARAVRETEVQATATK